MNSREVALHYLQRGLSVIPVKTWTEGEARKKQPLVPWERYQGQRASTEEVMAWYDSNPDAGVGIVTGRISGLVVIDEDSGRGGRESLEGLWRRHGAFPQGPVVFTPGGGRHFYFKHPGGIVRNAVDVVQGVDVRGDGGFVVAPPTELPDGRGWRWDEEHPLEFLPPPELPQWLLALLQEKDRPARVSGEEFTALYQGATEGKRHDAMLRLMGHFIATGISKDQLKLTLIGWNTRCIPPLEPEEFTQQFEDMWQRWGERDRVTIDKDIEALVEIPKDERYDLIVTLIKGFSARGATSEERLALRQKLSATLRFSKKDFDDLWKSLTKNGPKPAMPAVTFPSELLDEARTMLRGPDLLYRIFKATRDAGVVGEEENCLLTYLAMTSRLLDHPISAAVKGESAIGKSWMVTRVAALFPPGVVVDRSRLSPQALFYTDEDLSHKVLYIAEVAGGEAADYPIRLIQSEGKIIAEVTVRDEGGKFTTQRFEKQGPTSIITTTTRVTLNPENESRQWMLILDDGPKQTSLIKDMEYQRSTRRWSDPDLRLFQALQTLLLPRKVFMPDSLSGLAGKTPNEPVRMRRDFARLLTVIQTSALLHQFQRGDSEEIETTWQDFYMAQRVLGKTFTRSVSGIPEKAMAVYEAIKELSVTATEGATKKGLMAKLKVAPRTLHRYLDALTQAGVIESLNPKGGKGHFTVYTPLADPKLPALPGPEELIADLTGEVVDPVSGEVTRFGDVSV